MTTTTDFLDPNTSIALTEEPVLFVRVLRSDKASWSNAFVVDEMDRWLSSTPTHLILPPSAEELDDYAEHWNDVYAPVEETRWERIRFGFYRFVRRVLHLDNNDVYLEGN